MPSQRIASQQLNQFFWARYSFEKKVKETVQLSIK